MSGTAATVVYVAKGRGRGYSARGCPTTICAKGDPLLFDVGGHMESIVALTSLLGVLCPKA